jgi:gluconate 2-dehydrogenase alpha chain
MPRKLPSTDAVLVGFGWTGALMGQELTEAGLNVVAIERGSWRDTPTDFATSFVRMNCVIATKVIYSRSRRAKR